MQQYDVLIIGQGLAGSLLAYCLIKRGCTVLVLDNHHHACATQVAAGLVNPITGQRLNITDRFFEYSSEAKKMFWQIERDINCSVYQTIKQARLITDIKQADFLSKRITQAKYDTLLDDIDNTGGWFAASDAHPYAGINVSNTAVVDTKALLHCMHTWLLERNAIKRTPFRYELLTSNAQGVTYRENTLIVTAQKVVFCEGHQARNNPWLKGLPFKLAKGDIITLKPQYAIDRMLSWGKWLLPMRNGNAKLGSNYIWDDLSLRPTPDAAERFIADFEQHVGFTAELMGHEVGIRPSTKQRKPFVGPLSNLENAFCLNGLGSKGCLIAPHYVRLLGDHMLNGAPLPEEVTQWL